MTEDEVLQKMTVLFGEIFVRDDLVLLRTTTALDVEGWDSYKQIEIALAIEEQFDVKLRTRDMSRLKNVGELARFVVRNLPRSARSR